MKPRPTSLPWRWLKHLLGVGLAFGLATLPSAPALGCSTLLTGRGATIDGAVMMSHSCDGDVMGLVYVMPARTYPPGTRLPMYWNVPRPSTYAEYQDNLRKGYDHVGTLPVSETFRSLILAGNLESMTTGGLNEHGLCIAIEFLPMRQGLACSRGRVGPKAAEAFLTAYALECTSQVGSAYAALVDDLMYRFLVGDPELARRAPPRIAAPALPDAE